MAVFQLTPDQQASNHKTDTLVIALRYLSILILIKSSYREG